MCWRTRSVWALPKPIPTLDVGGGDTAHKLALLSSLAFGVVPELDRIKIDGIAHITPEDIGFAREFGFRIKLLGIARRRADGLDQRVQPAMVRAGTPLADVEGAFNAIVADAGAAGPFFFEGRGAGEAPTASAVVADLVDVARGANGPALGRPAASLQGACRAGTGPRLGLLSAFRRAGRAGRAGGNRRPAGGTPRFPSKA